MLSYKKFLENLHGNQWKEINYGEFENIHKNRNSKEFSIKQQESIRELLVVGKNNRFRGSIDFLSKYPWQNKPTMTVRRVHMVLSCCRLDDEWYIVRDHINSDYYLCDDFEGLLEFLKWFYGFDLYAELKESYREIKDTVEELHGKMVSNFTDREMVIIEKSLSSDFTISTKFPKYKIRIFGKRNIFDIVKFDDEWYLITFNITGGFESKSILCDQIDSVVQYFKDQH